MAEADSAVVTTLDAAYCIGLLPRRDPEGHKGTFGTVVCVAGSLDYLGAALLTAMSAVRGGAGLVVLAVPESLQSIVAGRVPEVVTLGLPRDAPAAFKRIEGVRPDALVIGPGLTDDADNYKLIVGILRSGGVPAVLDAGALTALAFTPNQLERKGHGRECILTPHPGEFARLIGAPVGGTDDERRLACASAATRFGQVVVLKGAHTVIAEPGGQVAVSPFANASLATAGSGDVLSGLIGALLAQGTTPFDAACLGVYLHGRAGERLSFRFGDSGLAASDLPIEIALARHELSAHSA